MCLAHIVWYGRYQLLLCYLSACGYSMTVKLLNLYNIYKRRKRHVIKVCDESIGFHGITIILLNIRYFTLGIACLERFSFHKLFSSFHQNTNKRLNLVQMHSQEHPSKHILSNSPQLLRTRI